jgi:DNA polymerase I-like protein with 3'-5' exonuclease and polymerase domains
MVRVHSALPEGARLIAMVHDEFIVECRQEQAEDVRTLMVETMRTAPEGFNVLMAVEAKIADNWGERIPECSLPGQFQIAQEAV